MSFAMEELALRNLLSLAQLDSSLSYSVLVDRVGQLAKRWSSLPLTASERVRLEAQRHHVLMELNNLLAEGWLRDEPDISG